MVYYIFYLLRSSFKIVNCPHWDLNIGPPPYALLSILTVNVLPFELGMMSGFITYLQVIKVHFTNINTIFMNLVQ